MKKIASLLLLLVAFNACTTDVTHNDPALQGLKDGELWRASISYAELSTSGAITLIGVKNYETITLAAVSKNPGTYVLGLNTGNRAGFEDTTTGLSYSTGTGIGDGQIVIKEYDPEKMTITGTFRFNADNVTDNPEGGEVLNFQQGNFYNVKVVPAL